jgi:hypothetical protein
MGGEWGCGVTVTGIGDGQAVRDGGRNSGRNGKNGGLGGKEEGADEAEEGSMAGREGTIER